MAALVEHQTHLGAAAVPQAAAAVVQDIRNRSNQRVATER